MPARAISAASWSGPDGSRWLVPQTPRIASSARSISAGSKGRGGIAQSRSHSTVDVPLGGKPRRRRLRLGEHRRQGLRVEVSLVERDPAFLHHARHDSGPGRAGADRADPGAAAAGDLVDLGGHPGRGEEGVAAAVHRRAAGMGGLAPEGDRMPLDAEGAEHRPQRQIEVEEHRPLLDVEFQVGRGGGEFPPAVLDLLEVDADLGQGGRQGDAGLVDQPPGLVHVEIARAGRRAEQALAEPRPLLVGPVDHAERDRRPAAMLFGHASHHLDAGERVEAAVEPAAVGHRIDVAADEHRLFPLARQRGPEVARRVGRASRRAARQTAPAARLGPRSRPA